jgi:hypothetical protein
VPSSFACRRMRQALSIFWCVTCAGSNTAPRFRRNSVQSVSPKKAAFGPHFCFGVRQAHSGFAPTGGAEKRRWYTFGGNIAGGASSATVPIYQNTGGNFNAAPITSGQVVGSATITFSSRTEGQLAYTFTDGSGRSGSIALTRLLSNVTCSVTSARPTSVDYALSGNWYNAATSGQGFIVEINPTVPVIFFAWYTYALGGQSQGAAGQRWFTGQANYVVGAKAMVVTLYETKGGAFNTSPTSAQTIVAIGTATLSFSSCTSGTLAYNLTGGANAGQSGTIALVRAGQTPVGCVV